MGTVLNKHPEEKVMAEDQKSWTDRYQLTARQDAPDFRDYAYQPALIKLKTSHLGARTGHLA
jgi:hypothetical protein